VRRTAAILLFAAAMSAADDPFAALEIEAHGYASFGYLRTWGNAWLGDTREGTADFWEAAVNAVARPADRLRLGAQVFARDLGRYDNGKPTLDWAYADWRADDAFGVQVGRYKVPLGLYNEVLDVDAARTPVFLPIAIYALRSRDIFISTDGAKIYGYADAGGAGSFEYQVYAGSKPFDPDMGFGSYFSEAGVGTEIDDIAVDLSVGAMVHWDAPWEGLGFRLSIGDAHGFRVSGRTPGLGIATTYAVDDYVIGIASAVWESSAWTVAAEYSRNYARGTIAVAPYGIVQDYRDDSDAAYIAATWHVRSWIELHAAGEASWADAYDRGGQRLLSGVLAVNLMPTSNWSLKVEGRFNRGTYNVSSADEPAGASDVWQILALKTTVDF